MKNKRGLQLLLIGVMAILIISLVVIGKPDNVEKQKNTSNEAENPVSLDDSNKKDNAESKEKKNTIYPYTNIAGEGVDYEDVIFVDDEIYETLKEAYSKVDFTTTFQKGKQENEDYYKEQYKKMLNCEVTFTDKERKEYLLKDFDEMKLNTDIDGGLNPKKFRYYFFDMDEDGHPELGVSDYARFNYIFKYAVR